MSNRASMRRSVRVSQRTADSGIDTFYEPKMLHAYSETDLRLVNDHIGASSHKSLIFEKSNNRCRYVAENAMTKRHSNRSQRFNRHKNKDRFRPERHTVERERMADRSPKRFVSILSLNMKKKT